jgi:hypothetical protein
MADLARQRHEGSRPSMGRSVSSTRVTRRPTDFSMGWQRFWPKLVIKFCQPERVDHHTQKGVTYVYCSSFHSGVPMFDLAAVVESGSKYPNVRFGSLAEIEARFRCVRSSPRSRHYSARSARSLSANSGRHDRRDHQAHRRRIASLRFSCAATVSAGD